MRTEPLIQLTRQQELDEADVTENICRRLLPKKAWQLPRGPGRMANICRSYLLGRIASAMDEAVWCYHTAPGRGAMCWRNDQRIHYVAVDRCLTVVADIARHSEHDLRNAISNYDPEKEAVLVLQYKRAMEMIWLGPGGRQRRRPISFLYSV